MSIFYIVNCVYRSTVMTTVKHFIGIEFTAERLVYHINVLITMVVLSLSTTESTIMTHVLVMTLYNHPFSSIMPRKWLVMALICIVNNPLLVSSV